VPYINAQILLPVLLLVTGLLVVYFNGVAALNEKTNPRANEVRISTETLATVDEENPNALSQLDAKNFTNGAVYSEGLGVFGDFFSVSTESKKLEIDITGATTKKVISLDYKDKVIIAAPDGEKIITPTTTAQKITVPGADGDKTFTVLAKEEKESWLSAFSHKIPMIFFIIVAALLLVLSITKKLSLIPILGLLLCLYLMTELGVTNWLRFGIWLLVGLVIYALYGYRNSNLNKQENASAES
jgi:hypothetical protein